MSDPLYRTKAWQRAREEALKRDNYICRKCWAQDALAPADTVHHIEKLEDAPERALELDNLMSLCRACHTAEHPRVEKKRPEVKRRARVIKG